MQIYYKNLINLIFIFSIQIVTSQWTQLGENINGETLGNYSGSAVDLNSDGSIVIIGEYANDDNGVTSGQIRVFNIEGNEWQQMGQDINGDEEGDGFGYSVSISGDGLTIAIGAPGNDENVYESGHVKIYTFINESWEQVGSNINGDGINGFSGSAISLNSEGTVVAIGAYNKESVNGINSGQVRIYGFVNGIWEQLGEDINGEEMSDRSGWSISLDDEGTIVAIGSPYNDGNGSESGQIRIFKYVNDSWVQIGEDIYGESDFYYFGSSLDLNSDGTILIGGTPYNNENGNQSGQVRVFQYLNGMWQQVGSDINGPLEGSYFGQSVKINDDGTIIIVGAPDFDYNGEKSGLVRAFKNTNDEWIQVGSDVYGENETDRAGASVGVNSNGSIIAIGSPGSDSNGSNSGQMRLFYDPVLNNDDFSKSNILVFPNPSNGVFKIINAENFHLNIFDIYGRMIIKSNIDESVFYSYNKVKLIQGVYFINISKGKINYTFKHIVK